MFAALLGFTCCAFAVIVGGILIVAYFEEE